MRIKNIQDVVRPDGDIAFITGCTGQDGSLMVDYLLKNTDVSVVGGVRRLSVENHINIKHLENESRFQLVNFDLMDSHSIYKVVEHLKPNYFINFAAQSFVAASWDLSRQTWECNSTGVLDCLEAIKRFQSNCRFYNAGSSEEFGNVEYEPQDENHPLRPRSPYGASKAAARTLVKVYRESYGLYAVQGWLFNHEGVRRGEEFVTRKITKGVSRIYDCIVNDKEFAPMELGNLDARRDWSDAEDMVDAVWRMLNQEKYGQLIPPLNITISKDTFVSNDYETWWKNNLVPNIKDYVVGSGEKHTIREFVEKAFDVVGITGEWKGNGTEEYFSYVDGPRKAVLEGCKLVVINPKFYRPAEVDVLLSNSTKIRNELGWKPTTTFSELVEKMVTKDLE